MRGSFKTLDESWSAQLPSHLCRQVWSGHVARRYPSHGVAGHRRLPGRQAPEGTGTGRPLDGGRRAESLSREEDGTSCAHSQTRVAESKVQPVRFEHPIPHGGRELARVRESGDSLRTCAQGRSAGTYLSTSAPEASETVSSQQTLWVPL